MHDYDVQLPTSFPGRVSLALEKHPGDEIGATA